MHGMQHVLMLTKIYEAKAMTNENGGLESLLEQSKERKLLNFDFIGKRNRK